LPDTTPPRDAQSSAYDTLSRGQLIALLKKRDAERRLGLVWERDEIDADKAIDRNFVVAELITDLCERPAPWENLVIEGDNYDALRWLRMTHRGQIKCIYIDPPYNTGNKDWVYNDDYVDANHRFRNSQWLEFLSSGSLIRRAMITR
jgi:adenine-specific DNA-methyltransferase